MKKRENWTSNLGFILAAAGSAIGLGNIWRFPYVTGTNGGAVFFIIYAVAILLIGFPVMVAEMSIGRSTQKNPVGAFKKLAPNTPWWLVGGVGVFSGFLILSYYSVVAGWSMSYIFKAIGGFSPGTDFAALFTQHTTGIVGPIFWHAVFMLLTVLVIRLGVVKGIQRVTKILMPLLFFILVILIIRSVTLQGAAKGLSFYLKPDFSKIKLQTFTDAISQAFFTLSLGMGAMITYGSYLTKRENINDNAVYVIIFNSLIAIMSGLAIFPAVFALGFDPGAGAGLTFITLPGVFANMPFGTIFGVLFFLLLTIAALTSSISLLEVVVSYFVDARDWERKKAAQMMGFIIFLVGIPTILGFSNWSEFSFLGLDIFGTYDWFANNIFLPLGGLLTSIFAGYIWKASNLIEEANDSKGKIKIGKAYTVILKYIVPVAIAGIMILNLVRSILK
jgi:NSS family neurotransmitter:Na+ symporter